MSCIVYKFTPPSKDVRYVVYYPEHDYEPPVEELRACTTNLEAQEVLSTNWNGKPELVLPKDIHAQVFDSVQGEGDAGGFYKYIEIELGE